MRCLGLLVPCSQNRHELEHRAHYAASWWKQGTECMYRFHGHAHRAFAKATGPIGEPPALCRVEAPSPRDVANHWRRRGAAGLTMTPGSRGVRQPVEFIYGALQAWRLRPRYFPSTCFINAEYRSMTSQVVRWPWPFGHVIQAPLFGIKRQ